jgi:hypothetical protein
MAGVSGSTGSGRRICSSSLRRRCPSSWPVAASIAAGCAIARQNTSTSTPLSPKSAALEDPPTNLHGVSVASLLKKPHAAWDKPAVTQFLRPYADKPSVQGYSIRSERYRYTVWSGGETGEELYDYNADPHEWHNLARDPAMQQIKSGLAQKMQTILRQRTSQV